MAPWLSDWWPQICETAERGGHTAAEIIEEVATGKAIGWPVSDGFLLLARTADDFLLIWLCAGRNVRDWWEDAERDVSAFAKGIGCQGLRLEGRKGWRRILPHWERAGDDDLVLKFASELANEA